MFISRVSLINHAANCYS